MWKIKRNVQVPPNRQKASPPLSCSKKESLIMQRKVHTDTDLSVIIITVIYVAKCGLKCDRRTTKENKRES